MDILQLSDRLLNMVIFQNTIQAYLLFLVVFMSLLVVFSSSKRFMLFHLRKFASITSSDFDDFIVGLISNIGWPVFTVVSLYIAVSTLTLSAQTHDLIKHVLVIVLTIRGVFLLQKIIEYAVNKALLRRISDDNISSRTMIKSVTWLAKWSLWVLGGLFILDNLGVNISALMAGIGIGGIAVAMASQAILGDAFSALCIYLDKPFEIGDFIIIDNSMGSVEHIGLKTTRIRSLSGEQLVFANSDLTKSRIRNYKRMQLRRIDFKIGVVYETPVEKVERIPQIIKDLLSRQENIKVDRVHFQAFGDFSLVYEIVYFVLSSDYNIYMDIQQSINLAIMKAFKEEGIGFAYPSQTLYIKKEPSAT